MKNILKSRGQSDIITVYEEKFALFFSHKPKLKTERCFL